MELEEIFNKYYDRIYSFTLFRVQNAHDAEDIASDVFFKAVKSFGSFNKEKASVSTWLFAIALNEIRTYYRKRRFHLQLDLDIPARDNVLNSVLANEQAKALGAAIARLHERQRNIILLKYYGQMNNKQIARLLKLTETNVGTILSRSIKILKKYLETCDGFNSGEYKESDKQ